jgi:peptide-methionine (S)-S-oxide reductase
MKPIITFFATIAGFVMMSCTSPTSPASNTTTTAMETAPASTNSANMDTVTLGAGCFWCVEAIFQQLNGVSSVASGYMGGRRENPTYEQVCSGATGHAEVIQVVFDPKVISFPELLEVFWGVHDPTTLNRQGADVGTQYRSVVFYHSAEQQQLAEAYKAKLNASGAFPSPVVTEISAASAFYVAEKYHQNYYNENGDQPYCSLVIRPKLEKFKKVFSEKLTK